jgi:hypothetical protein
VDPAHKKDGSIPRFLIRGVSRFGVGFGFDLGLAAGKPVEPPKPSAEVVLLIENRDLMAKQ